MAKFIQHPRLMAVLVDLYPAVGTVQAPVETRAPTGQIVQTWADQPRMIDIRCRIDSIGGSETRTPTQVYATATHQIWLDGYYPLIIPKMRFLSDGVAYNILLANNDSFGAFTTLIVEVVA